MRVFVTSFMTSLSATVSTGGHWTRSALGRGSTTTWFYQPGPGRYTRLDPLILLILLIYQLLPVTYLPITFSYLFTNYLLLLIFSNKMSWLECSEHYKRRLFHYVYIKYSWDLEHYQSGNKWTSKEHSLTICDTF